MIADVPPSMVLACARRNPRATVRGSSVGAADEAERRLRGQPLALPRDAVGALEVDRQLLHALVELRALQLGDRALGPGFARRVRRRSAARWLLSPMTRWSIHAAASRCRSIGVVHRTRGGR